MSRSILVLVVALLAGAALLPATAGAARSAEGRYIVVLEQSAGTPADVAELHGKRHGVKRQLLFRSALKGYSARIPADQVAALRRDPRVAYVEPDRLMSAQATQTGATWGLDRIDQRTLPLNSTFNYSRTGAGVTAYVIDTGIRPTHADFGGRGGRGLPERADGACGHGRDAGRPAQCRVARARRRGRADGRGRSRLPGGMAEGGWGLGMKERRAVVRCQLSFV